jgi:hypothetical protein
MIVNDNDPFHNQDERARVERLIVENKLRNLNTPVEHEEAQREIARRNGYVVRHGTVYIPMPDITAEPPQYPRRHF